MSLVRSLRALLRIPTYLLLLMYLMLGFVSFAVDLPDLHFESLLLHKLPLLVAGALVLGFWYINATSLNDYADFEIDKINLKGDASRPLVTGTLTRRNILKITVVSAAAVVLLSCFLGLLVVVCSLLLLVLNVIYSLKPIQISHRGFWAPLLLPIAYVLYPLWLAHSAIGGSLNHEQLLLSALLYLHFFSRIVLKDLRDVVGDKKFGKKTVVLQIGVAKTVRLAQATLALSVIGLSTVIVSSSRIGVIALIFLGVLGLSLLDQLTHSKDWPHQKPFVLGFGRTGTGILIVLLLVAGFAIHPAKFWQEALGFAIATIFIVSSAYELMRYSAPRSAAKVART